MLQTSLSILQEACICFSARQLARAMSELYSKTLSEAGVNGNQLLMLIAIYKSQPATVCKLADLLGLDQTTVTRNLKVLQKAQQVFLKKASSDKRFRMVSLTEKGLQTINIALPLWQKAQEKAKSIYGAAFTQQLIQLVQDNSQESIYTSL